MDREYSNGWIAHCIPCGCSDIGSPLSKDDGLYYINRKSAQLVYLRRNASRVIMPGLEPDAVLFLVNANFIIGAPSSGVFIEFNVRGSLASCPVIHGPSEILRVLLVRFAHARILAREYAQMKLRLPDGGILEASAPVTAEAAFIAAGVGRAAPKLYEPFRRRLVLDCQCGGRATARCRRSSLLEIAREDIDVTWASV
jgi:hypothetical protein